MKLPPLSPWTLGHLVARLNFCHAPCQEMRSRIHLTTTLRVTEIYSWFHLSTILQFEGFIESTLILGVFRRTDLDPMVSHEIYVAWTPYITLQNEFHKSLVKITFPSPSSSPCASQWPPASMNNFLNKDMTEISLIHTWCLLISASWCSISSPWLFFRLSSCFCCCCLKYWSSWAFSFLPNAPPASRTAPEGIIKG